MTSSLKKKLASGPRKKTGVGPNE